MGNDRRLEMTIEPSARKSARYAVLPTVLLLILITPLFIWTWLYQPMERRVELGNRIDVKWADTRLDFLRSRYYRYETITRWGADRFGPIEYLELPDGRDYILFGTKEIRERTPNYYQGRLVNHSIVILPDIPADVKPLLARGREIACGCRPSGTPG